MNLDCYLGPVTAITVCSTKALVGCGNEITVYNIKTKKCETRQQIFVGASVHGMKKGPWKDGSQLVCAFGAKQVCVLALTHCESHVEKSGIVILSPAVEMEDWIWDAAWITHAECPDLPIALALAHNSVVKWNWWERRVDQYRHCAEKCILYCAHFIGECWDNLILAAGTVFNKVVLWPVARSEDERNGSSVEILHTLSGHKGVIFSISYHSLFRKIFSVSDDRSICVWQLHFSCDKSVIPSIQDWKNVQSEQQLCLFGHSARVWDVVMMSHWFASVGEDATCCVWDYEGNIVRKFKGHKGQSIWSIAATEDEKYLLTGGGDASVRMWELGEVTAGAVSQQTLAIPPTVCQPEDFPRSVTVLNFDTVVIMMNSGMLLCYRVTCRALTVIMCDPRFYSYSVISPNSEAGLVAVGSISGILRVLRLTDNGADEVIFAEEALFSGKIFGLTWTDAQNLLVSGPEGCCILFKVGLRGDLDASDLAIILEKQYEVTLPVCKHRWVSAACRIHQSGEAVIGWGSALVCGDKSGSVHCYHLPLTPPYSSALHCSNIQPTNSFIRVHGKAGVTFVCCRERAVYTTGRDGFYRQWELRDDGTLVQLHGNRVIKGFDWIDRLEWYKGDLLLYGFFSSRFVVWNVSYNQQHLSVECGGGHRSWGCCHDNGTLRFVYLKSAQVFIVDSEQHAQQIILQAPLHGRELCCAKFIQVTSNQYASPVHIVATASEDTTISIGMFSKFNSEQTSWKPLACLKGHLSSVRSLAISQIDNSRDGSGYITTPLTQPALTSSPCESSQANSLISNLWTYLLFSGGGRAEVRVWKVTITIMVDSDGNVLDKRNSDSAEWLSPVGASDSNPVRCTYEHLSTLFLGESRHKHPFSNWKARKLILDPETRIMGLAVNAVSDLIHHRKNKLSHLFLLSTAGSDGVVRIFLFNELNKKFSALSQTSFHHGCVLQVFHHIHQTDGAGIFPILLTASTNGQIAVWHLDRILQLILKDRQIFNSSKLGMPEKSTCEGDCDSDQFGDADDYTDFLKAQHEREVDWEPLCVLSAHQSGVNSLHVLQISGSQLLIASGGDDNAVTVMLLEVSGSELALKRKVTRTDAHSAQVTGIWLLSSSLLVSASIDQRLCVWRILYADEEMMLEHVVSKYINVADVSGLHVWAHGCSVYLLIGGEGICVYSFHKESSEISHTV